MRLPSLKSISMEPFAKYKWIAPLITSLNQFIQQVYAALNGQLEFGVNVKAMIKTIKVDTDNIAYPIKFQSTIGKPQGVSIVAVNDVSGNPSTITTAIFLDWNYSGGQIKINNLIGLPATTKFQITLMVI